MECPVERKKRISNTIGLIVLLFFAFVLGGRYLFVKLKKDGELQATQKTLDEVADGFAKNDKEVMLKWARGEYKDSWGNGIVLVSDDRTTVVMGSSGPDGILDTEDDMRSERHRSVRKVSLAGVKESVASTQKKAEDALDAVKAAAEKGEAEGNKGGWRWSIRWGRGNKEDK